LPLVEDSSDLHSEATDNNTSFIIVDESSDLPRILPPTNLVKLFFGMN